jgi:vacuolar-type H+-ATPase subunit I/STV1
MKTLLNRRRTTAVEGIAHLVNVGTDPSLSAEPAADHAAHETVADAVQPVARPVRPVAALHPVHAVPAQSNGRAAQFADPADVELLMVQQAVTPLRVFRAFEYSASLLFHGKELKYYVVLYHDNAPWRALKAHDLDAAQAIFHQFELQATRLSDGQVRRLQLEAQNEQLSRLIAQAELQAERLRKALQRSGTHEQAVSARQHQVRREVAQLEAQRAAAQAQLNKVQRQPPQLDLAAHDGTPHLTGR